MAASRSKSGRAAVSEFVAQTHPLYDEWIASWRLAGENYEGDGGYLDGTNIIGHPREYVYQELADGSLGPVSGIKEKLRRRRQLARYDNFAQALTDIFVDHQYAKTITRTWQKPKQADENYLKWLENVDGDGTHLDTWLQQHQVLAHTYGHLPVLMEKQPLPDGKRPRSRAEQPPLVLRSYLAPDMLDWLAPRRQLRAVKFVEAVERESLTQPATFSNTYRGTGGGENSDDLNLEYLFYDQHEWTVYNQDGANLRTGAHGFGELPVAMFYSKTRSRIPVIGRPLLRDPRLFRDHFNLVSEMREVLRAQAFSMLHIQLQEGETVADAKARMGDHAGTDTVLFTMGGASFIAPADGPVVQLAEQTEAVERKMFRLVNLPWEGDSRDAESAESRRIKSQDLNRTLAGYADEAERFDYRIARLWYIGTYGRDQGLARLAANPIAIKHPDEFNTEEVIAEVEDTKAALGVQLGETAEKLLRKRLVPIVLRDLDPATRKTIDDEIEATPYNPMHASGQFEDLLNEAAAQTSAAGRKPTEAEAA